MSLSAFAGALLDPTRPVPPGLTDPDGRPAGRRFDVYRNNVVASLGRALGTAFPVVRSLVGDEYFAAMAGVFLRAHPPRSRQLALYGDEFPGFLGAFQPVAHLGYLPDVARLEQALRESYHAADHLPADLSGVSPDDLLARRLNLAPSLRMIRSGWPVYGIWAAHTGAGIGTGGAPQMRAEDVVVLRAGFDPVPHLLPPGGGAFLAALLAGEPLGAAIDAGGPNFEAGPVLGLFLTQGAVVEVGA